MCPGCGASGLEVFYEQGGVPAHSVLRFETRAEAIDFPRGTIRLAFCSGCGLVSNVAFQPELRAYSDRYEETQGFSPHFRHFARSLAADLVDRHDLRGKELLEVGCGKAEFLALVCELGGNHGIGIDPAAVPARIPASARGVIELIVDEYDDRYAHLSADLVICRHTLEHIPDVGDFLRLLATATRARGGARLFVEVPDLTRILRAGAFWDVYYEHCAYFSPGTLARLLRRAGLVVTALERTYEDQYLLAEARPAGPGVEPLRFSLEEEIDDLTALVARFGPAVSTSLSSWRTLLDNLRREGKRLAVWGSGSKGVAFLTALGAVEEVVAVVDVNPFRQGTFMAATGHPIVAPAALSRLRPDTVIVMNPVYCDEIARMLESLGVQAQIAALG